MAIVDKDHVITCPGVVIWEAVTKPDENESKPGTFKWNLRIAVDPNAPELAELNALVNQALANSKWNGTMPAGGNHPISPIDVDKFPELPGRVVFSAGTILGAPPVFSSTGAELQSMVYGPQLYNGTVVKLMVHAYPYDNKQKGINFGLDGVQIVDGKAPRLSIGAAGLGKAAVAAAFGGGAPAPVADAPPAPAPVQTAVTPQPGFLDVPPPAPAAGPQPTAKANGQSLEKMLSWPGWTLETLIANGYVTA